MKRLVCLGLGLLTAVGCGGGEPKDLLRDGGTDGAHEDAAPEPVCETPPTLAVGDTTGHPAPLGASASEARAGRIGEEALPAWPSDLAFWRDGDFVLANDRVAVVIEDARPSDGYDPWGGRPAGFARVEDGALVDPAEMGEILVLTGRSTVVTESVTVLADGSDGGAARIRARGPLRPLPFFDGIVSVLFSNDYREIPAAIDYVLEPGADHVDVYFVYASPRAVPTRVPQLMHGFMFVERTPSWAPEVGFDTADEMVPFLGFVDDDATSFAYWAPDEPFRPGIQQSGFASVFTDAFFIPPCAETERHHARIAIGGPGLDGVRQAVARARGESLREIAGVVRDASGDPAPGVRVHATDADGGHLGRAQTTREDGRFVVHVPEEATVQLWAFRRGDTLVGPVAAPAEGDATLSLAEGGWVTVEATDLDDAPIPVRVQVRPAAGDASQPPSAFGEPSITRGRTQVAFPVDGQTRLRVPAGENEIIVSRGYEYELHTEIIDVEEGEERTVTAALARVVDTEGVQCGDFHIHTHGSPDSGDDAADKLRSAAADGLEIPARSEHERIDPWQPLVESLGLGDWMYGLSSVELTTFLSFGHFGVVPIEPADGFNGGTPLWQRFPMPGSMDVELENLLPSELFAQVRARPEQPAIIVNHPRGPTNYFDAAHYDAATGLANEAMWDDTFTLVEFFNSTSWQELQGDQLLADWYSFLNRGRRVFAVGSSDSHGMASAPVGYPRTCLTLGTDDPRALDGPMVRDALLAGAHTISGGIYVDARVGDAAPGEDAMGLGELATIDVRVQAASWVDVDAIDVVVDGAIVASVPITGEDVVRFDDQIEVDVAPGGSWVVIAARGDVSLDPLHPGRLPFGLTNPIFLTR